MKPRRVDQLLRALQLVHRPPQNDLFDRAARDEANDSHRLGLSEAVHACRRLSAVETLRVQTRVMKCIRREQVSGPTNAEGVSSKISMFKNAKRARE